MHPARCPPPQPRPRSDFESLSICFRSACDPICFKTRSESAQNRIGVWAGSQGWLLSAGTGPGWAKYLELRWPKSSILFSKAWGPPQLQEKRSRSEKVILGALGEFRGILGAALRIQTLILGMRNSILGMASHDLSIRKPQFSEQLPERFPELVRTHIKDFYLPLRSRSA